MSSDEKAPQLPEIDFSNFVLSLAASAMMQLGIVPDPETGESLEPDFMIARHTIDTLEMLREKTRGNLDDEEAKLLDSMLYELRMRAVEKSAGS
jgi:hypothetical protein